MVFLEGPLCHRAAYQRLFRLTELPDANPTNRNLGRHGRRIQQSF